MADHFLVIDPRGYEITCSDETWDSHICDEHSYMAGSEELVKTTIQNCGVIYRDARKAHRHIYYGRIADKPYYMKVVVEFDSLHHGEVITAFRAANRKRGERKIWPRSKR